MQVAEVRCLVAVEVHFVVTELVLDDPDLSLQALPVRFVRQRRTLHPAGAVPDLFWHESLQVVTLLADRVRTLIRCRACLAHARERGRSAALLAMMGTTCCTSPWEIRWKPAIGPRP